jgi:uncharacterized OB-fold protein
VSGVPVFVCDTCGHSVFPARLLCPRCGAAGWRRTELEEGVVEETTVLRRAPGASSLEPVSIASVSLEPGVRVVARLESDVGPGARVRLEYRDGVTIARAAP